MKIITNLQIFAILVGIIISTIYFYNKTSKYSIEITSLAINPNNPSINDTITISVGLKNVKNIKAVRLFINVDRDSTKSFEMIKPDKENVYSWQIPPQQQFNNASFYIEAENIYGVKAYFPSTAPTVNANYIIVSSTKTVNNM